MMMALPDPNGTGQLYLQPLVPHHLQIHHTSGAGALNHSGNGDGKSANGNQTMFLRQRANAVSIRARRNNEQENRSR